MSYEGYTQGLCAKGHYSQWDAYDTIPKKCQYTGCKEKIVWTNAVNLTNGSYEGNERIDGFVELKIKSRKVCKCKKCGNVHSPEYITYKIPKNVGHKV